MDLPLPNSYWVIPGRFLAGEHPCSPGETDARQRTALLAGAGIDYFYDLTHPHEMPDYSPWLPAAAKYTRTPIGDMDVPEDAATMQEIQTRIRTALMFGRTLYVHCRAGIGRTGLVVGCYLVEQGLTGAAALGELNRLWLQSARSASWPTIPQTDAQADYIRAWLPRRVLVPRAPRPPRPRLKLR